MPEISATPLPHLGLVRVDLDWTMNFEEVTHARVERVRADTGQVQLLRPHTAYIGDYQALSGQRARLYDSEAPLDTPFYYRTAALHEPDVVYNGAFADTFKRTFSPGWGNGWEHFDGGAGGGVGTAGYSVNGAYAIDAPPAVNLRRYAHIDIGTSDHRVVTIVSLPALPVGGYASIRVCARMAEVNLTYYHARIDVAPNGAATLTLRRRLNDVLTTLGSVVNLGTYTAGSDLAVEVEARGDLVRCRAWNYLSAAPDWQIQVTDSAIPTGTRVALTSFLESTVTSMPYEYRWRTAVASRIGDGGYVPVTLDSQGRPWLREPLRPYLNRRLALRPSGSACSSEQGIYFVSMGDEVYRAMSSSFVGQNANLPYAIARPRGGAEATLVLATRTFADRDDLLDTLAPGSPVLFSAPAVYGIPDRYMDVRDVTVARGRQDHRIEPRVVSLPYVQVEAPRGPAKGPLGARYVDGGEETWGDVETAGKTYDDLIWVN